MAAEVKVAVAHSKVDQTHKRTVPERRLESLQPKVCKTPEELVEDVSRRYPVTMARLTK